MAESLEQIVIRILNQAGQTVGTGFLVAPGLGVTCAHVAAAAGAGPGGMLTLKCSPAPDGAVLLAQVLADSYSAADADDVAFLALPALPAGMAAALLGSARNCAGHPYRALGFARSAAAEARWAADEIDGLVPGRAGGELLQLKGEQVYHGLSGAPVLDLTHDRVVGMITRGEEERYTRFAYAIPVETLRRYYPALPLAEIAPPTATAAPAPFMVEPLPENFVARAVEYEAIVAALLEPSPPAPVGISAALLVPGSPAPVGISAALRGAGGYGKTTLARAVGHDPRIRAQFPGGILWVTLGENPPNLTGLVEDLIYRLSGERPNYTDLSAAATHLRQLLAPLRVLLVVDDVWQKASLNPFLNLGPGCACLVTTRNDDTLPARTRKINVDAMRDSEALELLSQVVVAEAGPVEALARRLGRWPLLLNLAAGQIATYLELGYAPQRALALVESAYTAHGLSAFNDQDSSQRERLADLSIGISVAHLTPDQRAHFLELAVFPEDSQIPLAAVALLWGFSAGWTAEESERTCAQLFRRSLLQQFDVERRIIRLHDVIRRYLLEQHGERISAVHETLLEAYRRACRTGWSSGAEDGYFFAHLAAHLAAAGQADELEQLLFDATWLAARLAHGGIGALLGDYDIGRSALADAQASLGVLQKTLRLAAHILVEDPRQLNEQLFGRLVAIPDRRVQRMLAAIEQKYPQPWLRPLAPCFAPPGSGEIQTLAGHEGAVLAVALSADGRLAVSASTDKTLKVWDLGSGAERFTLAGHLGAVNGVALSPDGRLAVSASNDNTLIVWDLGSGAERFTLAGHTHWVTDVAISPDGRLAVSTSEDHTLKVWDLGSGTERFTLAGHADNVMAVAIGPDGRLAVSASWDHTLKVWDLGSGAERFTLAGHAGAVNAVAISPDGRLAVSASSDGSLKVWDLASGTVRHTLTGNVQGVKGVAISPDGRLAVSAPDDEALKVWDLASGAERFTLAGHAEWVKAVAISPDGRLAVSASSDRTLKVWDLASGIELQTLKGHTGQVNSVVISPDGRLAVSASVDGTLKVWDLTSREERQILTGHKGEVNAVALSADGRLAVSAAWDETLKVWDLHRGGELHTLAGHTKVVSAVALSPDGRLAVSASWDGTLKVWDLASGDERFTLARHERGVTAVAVSPDGHLAISASYDRTLIVWDLASGTERHTLAGHTNWVKAVAISPKGRLAISASADRTLKVWDLASGAERFTLAGHKGEVNAVAISPDGRLAVSVASDLTLKVWDLGSGAERFTLAGHTDWVNTVALSADGLLAVSASSDLTLKVWDLGSGVERFTLAGHTDEVNAVALSADGRLAVSASDDHTLKVWDLGSRSQLASFTGNAPMDVVALAPAGGRITAADKLGNMYFLKMSHL